MIKPIYNIVDQEVKYSDLFIDIINSDKPFIRTRFKISNDIDSKQFLFDLRTSLIYEYEENEDFTLDIRDDGDSFILMLSKRIYE